MLSRVPLSYLIYALEGKETWYILLGLFMILAYFELNSLLNSNCQIPEVRPVIRVNKANKMLEALDEITLTRNYDCPEMAMQGTIDGMSAALPRSQIYVFSDASAKDYNLLDKALKIAQEKQLTVITIALEISPLDSRYILFLGYLINHGI